MSTEDKEIPTADEHASLKKRAWAGVVILVARTIVLQLMVLGGNVYLYRRLEVADFGAFAIVQFAIAFFAFFGDAGLGGALVQRKTEPTQRELASVWWLQIFISLAVIAVVWVGAPYGVRFWPGMPPAGVWLLRALSFELLLSALRVIPAILMERHLQFGRLAVLEILLSAGFYVTAVLLAMRGYGIYALLGAVLIQGALGVVAAFVMRPWRPSFAFDRETLRPILGFGVVFQAKNVFGFVTGAITPVYAGRALGEHAVGLINWSQNTAFFPLQFVSIISRISFPLYSRLQSDKKTFRETLELSIQATAIVTLAFVGLFFALGPNLIRVVFTEKWLPALPLLYIASIGIAIGFLAPVIVTALDALGHAGTTLRLSIFNTVMIWGGVPLATYFYGKTGFVAAFAAVMWIGNAAVIYVVKQVLPGTQVLRRIAVPMIAAAGAAAAARVTLSAYAVGPVSFAVATVAFLACYLAFLAALNPKGLRRVFTFIRRKEPVAEG